MTSLNAFLQSQILIAVFFLAISLAARIQRQIIFEDDNSLSPSNCSTPDRGPGRCIKLTSCTTLAESVSGNRLRTYFCGFEGVEPRVCCPLSREEIPNTTIAVRTTQRTTSVTARTTRSPPVRSTVQFEDEPLSTQNPNPGVMTKPPFLPSSCGLSLFASTRFTDGSRAAEGSWPWMVVVFVRRNNGALVPDCGGALVTNSHVVTAAHCVVTGRRSIPLDPSRIVVRLGSLSLSVPNDPDAVDVDVESIRPHEQFEYRTRKNDIAVLKLRVPVAFANSISPICLPYDSLRGENLTERSVTAISYANTASGSTSSDVLIRAEFLVQSQEACKRAYEPEVQISDGYMCVGTTDTSKDACRVESGSPLLVIGRNNSYYLVGIESFGRQCEQPNYPRVYTRITEFLDWLTRNLSD